MSIWAALAWGLGSSASLYLGQLLAGPMEKSRKAVGLMMGFGAGTMLSAVGYQLIPESSLEHGLAGGASFLLGALAYYVGDRIVERGGGGKRSAIAGAEDGGSGAAMFLGALLDGIPEAFILGITLALGGSISLAFVAAIFVSNIPQGLAGTTSLRDAGSSTRRITTMWGALTVTCGASVLTSMSRPDPSASSSVQRASVCAPDFSKSIAPTPGP